MRDIGGVVGAENDGFKELCRVRPVPLRRARIWHGLNGLVFSRERCGKRFGPMPNFKVQCCERCAVILRRSRHIRLLDRHRNRPSSVRITKLQARGRSDRFHETLTFGGRYLFVRVKIKPMRVKGSAVFA